MPFGVNPNLVARNTLLLIEGLRAKYLPMITSESPGCENVLEFPRIRVMIGEERRT
jgi:hypothetical protein